MKSLMAEPVNLLGLTGCISWPLVVTRSRCQTFSAEVSFAPGMHAVEGRGLGVNERGAVSAGLQTAVDPAHNWLPPPGPN